MTDTESTGLVSKFRVERLAPSSRGIDHSGCRYFVLDPQHDPIALKALARYISAAKDEGEHLLAADLHEWIIRLLPTPDVVDPYCPFHGSRPTAYDDCSCDRPARIGTTATLAREANE